MKLNPGIEGERQLTLQTNEEIGLALIAFTERVKTCFFNPELRSDLEWQVTSLGGVFKYQAQHPEIGVDSQSFVLEPEASTLALNAMQWLVNSKKHRKKMSMEALEFALAALER